VTRGTGPELSVVLPVYGNRDQLPELVSRLVPVLDGAAGRWEIVFVDDRAEDGAREWIERQRVADGRLRLVVNPRNLGQHRSVIEGLRVATGERTVVMDADLQDPPEAIPRLLAAWRDGLGAVLARRPEPYQKLVRHWSGRLFKRLVRGLVRSRIPAGTGMFLLVGSAARRAAVEDASDRPYVPILLVRSGLELVAVDIAKERRPDGVSSYRGRDRLGMGLKAIGQALHWRIRGR
jgi:glycosyltransferase involved in cell wall biosynthesis